MPAIEPDPSRPDLDDVINVSEAHERLLRESAAAAREKPLAAGTLGPVPLWLIAVGGLVLVFAGGVLGASGKWFRYGQLSRPNYIRAVPEGAAQAGPEPMPALDALVRRGRKIYTRCAACHGSDGKGDGANYPSLVGSEWALGSTQRFAMIVLNGLEGPTSTGKAYAAAMPMQGAGMTAEDLAAVLTFVRNDLGNETGDVVSVAQAQTALDVSAARARAPQAVNADELSAEHDKELEGEPLAADVLVNPGTLAPVPVPVPEQ